MEGLWLAPVEQRYQDEGSHQDGVAWRMELFGKRISAIHAVQSHVLCKRLFLFISPLVYQGKCFLAEPAEYPAVWTAIFVHHFL